MSQVRSVLRAKDQFVAVACSHLSFNRANNSARRECGGQMTAPSSLVAPPICHLVSMSSLLTEWGKNWVLSSESTRVFTIEAGGREGWRLVRIHVWVCVSPTLGVVECGTFECDPEFVTCIWAAFGDNNTFLVNGYDDHTVQALFVVDRSGKAVRTLVPHSYEKVGFVGVNSKWLAVYSGNDLVLWKLEDRCLPRDHDGVTVRLDPHNARVIEQSFGGDLSPLDVDKATLWNYRHSTTATTTQVTVVNLETSFNNWKTGAVIDEVLGIPRRPCGSIWIGNTLHTLHSSGDVIRGIHEGHVFNTKTKKTVHTFRNTSVLGTVWPHHLFCIQERHTVMNVFRSSDLNNPCCVHHPVRGFPGNSIPNCGIVPVPVPTTATSCTSTPQNPRGKGITLDLCDTYTGVVLARFSDPNLQLHN